MGFNSAFKGLKYVICVKYGLLEVKSRGV